MIEKKKGVIMNISSASSMIPPPLLTIYAATKAFVNKFSEGLALECGSKGVTVQNVAPYFVATKLSKMRPSLLTPTPNKYVRETLMTVGHMDCTHGALFHDLEGYVFDSLPTWVMSSIVMKNMLSTRARALKKKERAAAAAKKE